MFRSFSSCWTSKGDKNNQYNRYDELYKATHKQDNHLRIGTLEECREGLNMHVSSMRLLRLPSSYSRSRMMLLIMLLTLALLNTVDFSSSSTSRLMERLLHDEKESVDAVLHLDLAVTKNVHATLQSAR